MAEDKHIRIRVIPNSSDSSVEKSKEGAAYTVYVRSAAESGRANKEAIRLIKAFLGVKRQIRIVSGHRSQQKILAIAIHNNH